MIAVTLHRNVSCMVIEAKSVYILFPNLSVFYKVVLSWRRPAGVITLDGTGVGDWLGLLPLCWERVVTRHGKKKINFMRSLLNFFSIEADGASLAMYCSKVLRLGYEYKMHKRIVNKRIQTRAVHLALWL